MKPLKFLVVFVLLKQKKKIIAKKCMTFDTKNKWVLKRYDNWNEFQKTCTWLKLQPGSGMSFMAYITYLNITYKYGSLNFLEFYYW